MMLSKSVAMIPIKRGAAKIPKGNSMKHIIKSLQKEKSEKGRGREWKTEHVRTNTENAEMEHSRSEENGTRLRTVFEESRVPALQHAPLHRICKENNDKTRYNSLRLLLSEEMQKELDGENTIRPLLVLLPLRVSRREEAACPPPLHALLLGDDARCEHTRPHVEENEPGKPMLHSQTKHGSTFAHSAYDE